MSELEEMGFLEKPHTSAGRIPSPQGYRLYVDELMEQPAELPPDHQEVLEAVLALPPKYRDVVYLHYYEAYTAPEIGQILGKNVNTVYTLLTRSKQMLRKKLGGDGDA